MPNQLPKPGLEKVSLVLGIENSVVMLRVPSRAAAPRAARTSMRNLALEQSVQRRWARDKGRGR